MNIADILAFTTMIVFVVLSTSFWLFLLSMITRWASAALNEGSYFLALLSFVFFFATVAGMVISLSNVLFVLGQMIGAI
jgi:hypothetical protein